MAITQTSQPAPFGAESTLRMVNAFDRMIAGIVGAYKARKTEIALNKLSDRQLEDIGLVRANIPAVALRAAHM